MDYSLSDLKSIMSDGDGIFGGNGFLWVILIFLFFLGFSGGGLFGGNTNTDLAQTQRDILENTSANQRLILETTSANKEATMTNAYQTLLGFKDQQLQISQCCLTIFKKIVAVLKTIFVGNHSSNAMLGAT